MEKQTRAPRPLYLVTAKIESGEMPLGVFKTVKEVTNAYTTVPGIGPYSTIAKRIAEQRGLVPLPAVMHECRRVEGKGGAGWKCERVTVWELVPGVAFELSPQ